MVVDRYANLRKMVRLPAMAMKTYKILQPPDTHIVSTCEAVGCEGWKNGWDSIIDESTELGQNQANWIRSGNTGRSYRELPRTDLGLTVFRFEAHQRCFAEHRTRQQIFGVVGGDFRGNPLHLPPRRHARPIDWVEDFALHQQAIADRLEKG